MATITANKPAIAGALAAFAATTVGGDEVAYTGGDLLIEFENTHTVAVTVNFAPVITTGSVPGAGPVTIPTRSLAVTADTGRAQFLFKASQIRNYLNSNKRVPITYTGGNAGLLIRASRIN